MPVTPEELSKIRALPNDLARRCVQQRSVAVSEAPPSTLSHQAWDHPLSLSDVRRRLALQCDRLRATAGGQAREAARTAQAARELALEHKVVCGQVAELQQRLEIASEDSASSRREVDWLRRVLEAAVGLREASITMNEPKEFRRQETKPAEPAEPSTEIRSQKEQGSSGSEADLQRTQDAAEKHVARANRQTQLRRARRRQCRLRRAAEEAAKATMLADPEGAATLLQLSEDGALPTIGGSDQPATVSPGRVVPARTGLTTPRGTPSVSRRESLLGQVFEHNEVPVQSHQVQQMQLQQMHQAHQAHQAHAAHPAHQSLPSHSSHSSHASHQRHQSHQAHQAHHALHSEGSANGVGFFVAHAVELANVPTGAHVPASFVKSLKDPCGVPRVAAAVQMIPMAVRRGA